MSNVFSRQTPIADEYSSCLETRAELRIYPGGMSPHEVTKRLGIEPSKVNVAGEDVVNAQGYRRIIKINGWFLSSEGRVNSLDTRRHLDWLLAHLEPEKAALLELQSMVSMKMGVCCAWYSRAGHGGPTLWPEQMHALADLNLECSFDIYFLADERD